MKIVDAIENYHQTLWGEKNTDIIFDIFTENVKIHSPLKTVVGSNELKNIADSWLLAFPDLEVSWEQLLASENKVVANWSATGTHQNKFLDIDATNKKIKYRGVTLYEFENYKVVEYWALVDMDVVKKQLC